MQQQNERTNERDKGVGLSLRASERVRQADSQDRSTQERNIASFAKRTTSMCRKYERKATLSRPKTQILHGINMHVSTYIHDLGIPLESLLAT